MKNNPVYQPRLGYTNWVSRLTQMGRLINLNYNSNWVSSAGCVKFVLLKLRQSQIEC